MPALHFGANTAPFFANVVNSTTMCFYAIRNPLTAADARQHHRHHPSLRRGRRRTHLCNGGAVPNAGMTMPCFRNGRLWVVHNAAVSGRNVARWHEFNMNTWPNSWCYDPRAVR